MKLINNLYYEVLKAHFNHLLSYEKVTKSKNGEIICEGYRFPSNFFKLMEDPELKSQQEIQAYHFWTEANLTAAGAPYPKLQGVAKPLVKYGWVKVPFLFKTLVVPHFDGSASIITCRYHFYKLSALLSCLLTRNPRKKTEIFTLKLRTLNTQILPNLYPRWDTNLKKADTTNLQNNNDYAQDITNASHRMNTRQHCLLIIYLLKGLGIDFQQESLVDMAKIISTIMGKDYMRLGEQLPKIEHGYIYKTLKKIRKLDDTQLFDDLIEVQDTLIWCSDHLQSKALKNIVTMLKTKTQQKNLGLSPLKIRTIPEKKV